MLARQQSAGLEFKDEPNDSTESTWLFGKVQAAFTDPQFVLDTCREGRVEEPRQSWFEWKKQGKRKEVRNEHTGHRNSQQIPQEHRTESKHFCMFARFSIWEPKKNNILLRINHWFWLLRILECKKTTHIIHTNNDGYIVVKISCRTSWIQSDSLLNFKKKTAIYISSEMICSNWNLFE